MSTLLIKRAHRTLLFSLAAILTATLLAPLAAVADTDLVIGDTAAVNAGGANLRSDISVVDDSTLIAELPEGSTVYVQDGPFYTDTGVWVYVASDGFGPGYVSADLLSRIGTEELAESNGITEEPVAEEAAPVSEIAWLEPIDSLVVVDYNIELPAEGLAVRNGASHDSEILGYAPVGTSLDVTSGREWVGDVNFVRVNWGGAGAYVDGSYVELTSEAMVEEPTEEVIWIDEEAPAEEVPTEEVVTEVPTEEVVTEVPAEEVVTEVPTEEVVTEVPTEEVVTEVPTEEVVAEEPTEEVVAEEPTEEVVAEEPTEEVVAEVPTEEVVAEEPTEEVAASPTAEVTETVAPEATATVDATEAPVETEAATEAPVETAAPTEAAAKTVAPTEAPAKTAAPTEAAAETVAPTEAPKPVSIASTAKSFNADTMIGSATVTGTSSGLLCRVSPDPASAVLMTLSEGTKVLVSAEPVNGYLGIDCGGLQGYADVNYLWSGGAGDAEISASRMSIVVTGTGNGLNCRTGAGLSNSIITTVMDGTVLVTRGAAKNGWTPVTCAGQNGFVSTTWIEVRAGSGSTSGGGATSGTAKVNTGGDGLYCRSGAGTSYGVITVLSHGSTVSVRGAQQGAWVPVTCGGAAGFAHSDYLSVTAGSGTTTPPSSGAGTATGTVTVANTGGQGLNCRTGAGTGNAIITTLALGQTVQTRSGSTSGWTAVICGGTNGFVSSEFVSGASAGTTPTTPAPAPTGLVKGNHAKTTDSVNLRYSGSLSSSVVTVVSPGIVVLVTGSASNSFVPVSYDGLNGYIHSDYLAKTTAALSERGGSGTPTEPTAPTAPTNPGGSATGNAMVNYAMRYEGYPYVWATHGPASFDCSGFTYWVVLNVTGKNIGYGTWTQVSAGTPVSKANLQPGDLVFFQNTYTAGLSHVGLYIGNGQFIHAQNEETGVVISDLNSSYYGSRWYGAVRL